VTALVLILGLCAVATLALPASETAVASGHEPQVRFDANRPFLFFLRDDRTGAALFAGTVSEPPAASEG
jgi:serine protease inhibitor